MKIRCTEIQINHHNLMAKFCNCCSKIGRDKTFANTAFTTAYGIYFRHI
ncbi:hypothetical protein D1AOALGA4SA_8214 [Olavius algarvensis Delta 1 endosymbiont]|nr:hypothetical protein D1AOALGA4SA_8214 [Olavius algarvensis Delta 1 endosymbiont]